MRRPAAPARAPEQVPQIHGLASSWYAAHDLVEDAVRHALPAGDVDRAAQLIEAAVPELRRTRQDGLLLSWVRSLPPTAGADHSPGAADAGPAAEERSEPEQEPVGDVRPPAVRHTGSARLGSRVRPGCVQDLRDQART